MSDCSVPKPKTLSEKLFDDLQGKDSMYHENDYPINGDMSESKEIEMNTLPKDNSDKDAVKEQTFFDKQGNTSKFKGLFEKVDNSSIEDICVKLQNENSFAAKCQSVLSLAVICRSKLNEKDCKSIFDALNSIPDHQYHQLSFCQSLLLYFLTKQNITVDQFSLLENQILRLAHSVIQYDDISGSVFVEAKIVLLGGERYLIAWKLCKEIFSEENIDIHSLDVSTICCSSLRSLSKSKIVSVGINKLTDATLKYIISMIGKSTQEIISERIIDIEVEEEISISSFTVNQCLQVLEQILSADPSSPVKTLDHEDYSLLRCLTKLIECSISSLFPDHDSENELYGVQSTLHAFYLSTLVSLLKVFSILSLDDEQYECYTNTKGTLEKIMICILKIYFQSEGNHFDVLVLAMESLINFGIKCKKTFALVCLKRFKMNETEEVFAIEALIKILNTNLQNIKKVKSIQATRPRNEAQEETNQDDSDSSQEHNMELVLKAADEDMELSTIVSFIGILLMLFIDTKRSFVDFLRERLPEEKCTETVEVTKKLLQFAILTGGMIPTGILLLRASIDSITSLYSSS